jgi:predicted amidohydrolase YtcJ
MAKSIDTPDRVFLNGKIYTVNPSQPWAEALAVGGNKILRVGSSAEIKALASEGTETIDLQGRMVLPGINDVHVHPLIGGRTALYETTFLPTSSLEEILEVIRAAAREAKPDAWIIGGSWGSNFTTTLSSLETLRALDEASGGHPVLLRDDSVHNRWVNSRALELAGIDANTPDPNNGIIVRDPASGVPVGLLFEAASHRVERVARAAHPDTLETDSVALARALEILNSYGVTGLQDAAVSGDVLAAYANLERQGKLSTWVVTSLVADPTAFLSGTTGDTLIESRERFASRHINTSYVKIFLDGVPMSRTSAFIKPYLPDQAHGCCFCGDTTKTLPELVRLIAAQEERGLGVKIHAAGDCAVRMALDAIDVIRSLRGPTKLTHHIAHAGFVDASDIARFKSLNVVADLSPILWFPNQIIDGIEQAVGERVRQYWPNRSLIEAGALIATGTDWPVIPNPDPWSGMQGLITRRNPDSRFAGALWPEQAIDLASAIQAYTLNPARAMGLEAITGSIAEGKSADFIVIDRNLFEIEATTIAETKVVATYFEGNLVFQR